MKTNVYANERSLQPVCQNCTTSTTPLWRRDESGSVLCNACGLFLKLHGRPRPISLKTDVIKSRNRVKTSQTPRKHDRNGNLADSPQNHSQPGPGFPAAHPDVAHAHGGAQGYPPQGLPHTAHMGGGLSHAQAHGQAQDRIVSPGTSLSRSGTPSQHQNPNIAPQHIFDTVTLPNDSFTSPAPHHLDTPQNFDALAAHNNALRTRVSELEVINDLFKGRVSELETSEQEARQEVDALKRGSAEVVADTTTSEAQDAERATKKAKLNDNHENDSGEAGFAEFTRGDEAVQETESAEAKQ
jgi:GATA-binding protein